MVRSQLVRVALLGLLLGTAVQAQSLVARLDEPSDSPAPERVVTTRTVFVGRVLGQRARAAHATVVSSAGGEVAVAPDGTFELEADVPLDAEYVDVTALAEGRHGNDLSASVRVVPTSLSPVTSVGTLLLTQSPFCSPKWVPTFGGSPGADGGVLDLLTFDDGTGEALFACGSFLAIGGVPAKGIAKWDGGRWMRPGILPASFGNVMTSFDDGNGPELYVGLSSAPSMARWNGSTWSTLGAGLSGEVFALAAFDDGNGPALYAGGSLFAPGTPPANGIGKWDGSAWSGLRSGVNGTVRALAAFDDGSGPSLFLAGSFTKAGALSVPGIARWDGTDWARVGSGSASGIQTLVVFDDGSGPALYAGGSFVTIGGSSANRVAKWDGSTWSALGSGMDDTVFELKVLDDGGGPALHACGAFSTAGGLAARRFSKWNGTSWSTQAVGPNESSSFPMRALEIFGGPGNSQLHAGGSFLSVGDVSALRIARFDGSEWSALTARGLDGPVTSLAVFDDGNGEALYVSGDFSSADGQALNHIARWDGANWSPLESGLSDGAESLAVFDDGNGPALYACGRSSGQLEKWDGAAWSTLAHGELYALATFGDGLYVGGRFDHVGGVVANHIAKWNGSTWSPLGSGVDAPFPLVAVTTMHVFDDGNGPDLYVGGNFVEAGGLSSRCIARWDGSSWSSVVSLFAVSVPIVTAMAVMDDGSGEALYLSGSFTTDGVTALNGIAKWNGSTMQALGSGLSGVTALGAFDDGSGPALYAGGNFSSAGGVAAPGIARWNGSSWSTPGGLTPGDPTVNAFARFEAGNGPALIVGGLFGGSSARDSFLAAWGCGRGPRPAQLR